MIDFHKPCRMAFFNLLNGQISYNSALVPIFDQKVRKGDSSNLYVNIVAMGSVDDVTMQNFSRKISVTLDITTKTTDTISTDIADDIAAQIFALAMPSIGIVGLADTADIQWSTISLSSDRYLELLLATTTTQVRRLLTFVIKANQLR